ncbi:MAG: DNA-3-methyladenine glycosylase I [Chthoniobacterales bacterium]
MSYCSYIKTITDAKKEVHKTYHDTQYGFPLYDDNELFGRLILEINQAGLSWETILKKEAAFRKAYDHFDIKKIAAYGEADKTRLLGDAGIIRNRLKINAAIENAKVILQLQKEYGSFKHWLASHHPKSKEAWVKLFRKTFRFTGGEIVGEFLMSIGFLPGAHTADCPIYEKILAAGPLWKSAQEK